VIACKICDISSQIAINSLFFRIMTKRFSLLIAGLATHKITHIPELGAIQTHEFCAPWRRFPSAKPKYDWQTTDFTDLTD
jgi:hypothetical protein